MTEWRNSTRRAKAMNENNRLGILFALAFIALVVSRLITLSLGYGFIRLIAVAFVVFIVFLVTIEVLLEWKQVSVDYDKAIIDAKVNLLSLQEKGADIAYDAQVNPPTITFTVKNFEEFLDVYDRMGSPTVYVTNYRDKYQYFYIFDSSMKTAWRWYAI